MYLYNKYTNWYNLIIERAKTRVLSVDVYTETHHIVPKACGGNNNLENLVRLTAREHFICHRLLPKMTTGIYRQKMVYALWCLVNVKNSSQHRHKVSSHEYSVIKTKMREVHKLYSHSNEIRYKISIGNAGKTVSTETRQKMSKSAFLRGSNQTLATIEKSKNTKEQNGTTGAMYTPAANAKRVNTRRQNGAIDNWVKASHTPAAIEKASESRRKIYKATDSQGNEYITKNLKQFCTIHQLQYNGMIQAAKKDNIYRGWKCSKV